MSREKNSSGPKIFGPLPTTRASAWTLLVIGIQFRSREDFERTRDLWDTGHMEATDYQPEAYQLARGNATRAYQPSKMEYFTRESRLHARQ